MGFVFAPRLRTVSIHRLPDLVGTCGAHGAPAEVEVKALWFPSQVAMGQELACFCFLVGGELFVIEVVNPVRVVLPPEGH